MFGPDVSPANLPQEINRDARTLNFRKGCYLGQETVARLDSLGHVNKILKIGRVEGSRGSARRLESGIGRTRGRHGDVGGVFGMFGRAGVLALREKERHRRGCGVVDPFGRSTSEGGI